ncbi:MAG: FtsB family cell division protein [Polyangiales bacterium]
MSASTSSWVWGLPLVLLLVALLAVPLSMLEPAGLPRYQALSRELERMQRANRKLSFEVRALESKVRALRHDPRAIEALARHELGMIRPGEVVFQVEP